MRWSPITPARGMRRQASSGSAGLLKRVVVALPRLRILRIKNDRTASVEDSKEPQRRGRTGECGHSTSEHSRFQRSARLRWSAGRLSSRRHLVPHDRVGDDPMAGSPAVSDRRRGVGSAARRRVGLSAGGFLAAARRTGLATCHRIRLSMSTRRGGCFHPSACWTCSSGSCSWRLAASARGPVRSAVVHGVGIRAPRYR